MPAGPPRPAYHHWRDIDGTPIPDRCRIEQVAVSQQHGGMPARLHQQGQVIGWDTTWLQVCFDDQRLVVLRAHLVRVLDHTPGGN